MKFNNLGLALEVALKFYTSVAKEFRLKVREFCGKIPTFVEVTGEKLVGEAFLPPPRSPLILNRVSRINYSIIILCFEWKIGKLENI